MQFVGNQQYAHFKKFANDILLIPSNGLLRKLASIFLDFIGCKDTHFSQMLQTFCTFSSFSKEMQNADLSYFSQNA